MTTNLDVTQAVGRLRAILPQAQKTQVFQGIVDARDEVLGWWQAVFAADHIADLTPEEFTQFLLFDGNRHWTGLARKGKAACGDMAGLREALRVLLDDAKPIEERLDAVLPKPPQPHVAGLGKAIVTGIMLVTHPGEYGVWNGTSETALNRLGVFPESSRGAAFSERYLMFNSVLLGLARDLDLDLWTLDALLFIYTQHAEMEGEGDDTVLPDDDGQAQLRFGLEKYLHVFLSDNWDDLDIGQQWALYEEDGEAAGFKYNTAEVGEIDLLAKHRTEPRWLVVELKRDQSSDATVGQLLRYMGWVEKNLASQGDVVEGLIIAYGSDMRIQYALTQTPRVQLSLYGVDFRLTPAPLP